MKFSLDVECTAQELRTFMGLPDVAPMQKAIMDELQGRMLSSLDHLSPSGLVRDWFSTSTVMQKRLLNLFAKAQSAEKDAPADATRPSPYARTVDDE